MVLLEWKEVEQKVKACGDGWTWEAWTVLFLVEGGGVGSESWSCWLELDGVVLVEGGGVSSESWICWLELDGVVLVEGGGMDSESWSCCLELDGVVLVEGGGVAVKAGPVAWSWTVLF